MFNLDSITSEMDFLTPYYKQFLRYLKGSNVLILEEFPIKASKLLTDNNIKVISAKECVSLESKVDGIIINNIIDYENIKTYLEYIDSSITDDGIVLIISNNNKFDTESIKYNFKTILNQIEEFIGDDKWNFILYAKKDY